MSKLLDRFRYFKQKGDTFVRRPWSGDVYQPRLGRQLSPALAV